MAKLRACLDQSEPGYRVRPAISLGSRLRHLLLTSLGCLGLLAYGPGIAHAAAPARLEVVEQGSSWPVPLVELRTTGQQRFVTDNAGVVALDEPHLLGREVWFGVRGHGYEVPADGFGYQGVRIRPQSGQTHRITVRRTSVARRLGRITGAGLYSESQRLGEHLDWVESGVTGCDSIQNAVHRGRLHWIWGDTTLPHYPLGIFDATGATTAPQALARLEPPVKLRLELWRDAEGRPRAVAPLGGSGPTWLSALASVPDRTGSPCLVASFVKIRPPLDTYRRGLAVWDDAQSRFHTVRDVPTNAPAPARPLPFPDGHAVTWTDPQGRAWLLFGNPLPELRCPATFEAWQDPSTWEVLVPQATLKDAAGGPDVRPHSGSIAWHPGRRRWVTVFTQARGRRSAFGEVWYAEAETPTGPWGTAVQVLSHDNYTFYNPRLHPELVPGETPVLLFEGTYSKDFADRPEPTPRYDYNQVLYRLDLDDPRLAPAQVSVQTLPPQP